MNESNGAPYNIEVTKIWGPDKTKKTIYPCLNAEMVLADLTTLGLVHIKENIRGRKDVRMIFEIVAAPPEKSEEENGTKQRSVNKKKAADPPPKGKEEGDADSTDRADEPGG